MVLRTRQGGAQAARGGVPVIVTVHRSEVVLTRGDDRVIAWHEYSFTPLDLDVSVRQGGSALTRWPSAPVAIAAPVGCRLTDGPLARLVTHFDGHGLDAQSVHHLASRRLRGFALAEDEPEPRLDVKQVDRPTAPAPKPERWGIAFASRALPELRSWLATPRRGSPVRSTLELGEVVTWPDREGAAAWLESAGLAVDRPVSPGLEFLFPSVVQVPAELPWCAAVVFALPRAGLADRTPACPGGPPTSRAEPVDWGGQGLLFAV